MNQKKMMVILFLFGFILGAITCSDKEFQCGNGKCINVAKQCDGYPDCLDKSDEIDRCGAECVLNDLKKFLFKDEPIKAVYRNGDKIQIYCPMDLAYGYAYYDEETSAELTCKNGSWVGNVPQCISNQDSNIKSTPGADLDTVTNPGEVDTTQHVMAGSTSYIDSEFRSVRDDEITPNPNIGSKNTTEELLTNKATCQLDGFSQYLMKNQLTEKSYRHGQKIIITCPHSDDHGYDYDQLSDDSHSELTCHDGQWIGSYPECFKGCRSKVLNDFLVEEQNIIDEYRSGEIISVSCFRKSSESQIGKNIWGYESGNQTRADMIRNLICLNGQWVGEYPECFALCRRSSIQGNLMKETESEYFLPGDVVQIKICWGNIPVEGDGHLTCMANGSWYGNSSCPPQSVLDCVPPHDIQNAYISGSHWDRYPEGSVIIYKCSQSYWLRGDNKVKCINGKWTEKQFHCEIRTCQYPGEIENGQILNNSVKVGQHIHFRCDEGYTLKGPNMMLCYADGNFHSDIMPVCEAVQCQPLRPPEHGWIDHYEVSNGRASNNYGSFVRIRCKHGYQLIGSERRQCQADRTWSGEDAICQRQSANCYVIPVVRGAILEGQQSQWYLHGSNISYRCVQNYTLRGNRHFSCNDGQWMGGGFNCTSPVCELSPLDLRYGKFSSLEQMTIVHGDSMSIRKTIKCNDGYTVPPNISYVSCYNSTLDPPKFDCVKYDDSIRSCHLSKDEGIVIRYKDKCYLVTYSTFTYRHKDAENFCQKLGSNAHLAIVPDKETNEAIRYLINMAPGENKYWFGAMWKRHTNRWEWQNEIPLNYTNWKSGEGRKTADVKFEECAVLKSDGHWEDKFCRNFGIIGQKYKAICEIAVDW
ncbi:hypothetical protein ACJMK2_040062 [Sinanodonta woodiana]|uniref:Uncharacterized protein n=1 Tax=Sinanodonta woodiana TaxID=1069815 RepID=A0ABD3WHY5_SINWO